MKKLIAILLASSLGFTAAASAKDDKKKNKSGPPQQQHIKSAPQSKMKVQKTQSMSNARSNSAKVQMKELRNSNVVKPNRNPVTKTVATDKFQKNTKTKQFDQQQNLQTNQLPKNQKNQKNWVNNQQNTNNFHKNSAKYKNFKAKRNSSIASVQFNQNYRIQNSQNWNGRQYRVFQSYRPQWHDRSWWRSRYASRILLIGGGYYYWNSGYWYPAWGYDSAYSYYPYDGPIYVGDNQVPFDRVLANVQSSLQDQGYYRGEIDGLMGPLTREALANYQRDHGLISTAALDQPTLASLGLG